ncbi:hypothetical protein D3C72_114140 [compost metagenome]
MTQPNMPHLPGFDAMADTMEFVKNMWGGMKPPASGIPGMVMPTLSVEEINKQITDLKAVEAWLSANMNMLRGTIQALEVQSATISTLRSMGQTFAPEPKAEAAAEPVTPVASDPLHATAAAATSTAWWNMLQDQFNQAVSSVMSEEAGLQKTAAAQPAAKKPAAGKKPDAKSSASKAPAKKAARKRPAAL